MKKKIDLERILNRPSLAFQKLHQRTKIKKFKKESDKKNWPKEWKEVNYKGYSRFEEMILPVPKLDLKIPLKHVLLKRKSERKFSVSPLSLEKISSLLFYSAGIKNDLKRRLYPSAGARYPLEIYIISLNTKLPQGIYHYYLKNNSLEKLFEFKKKDLSLIIKQKWAQKAGCLIIISSVFERNTVKYGERGYRHILTEAGHLAQNFYLVSTALGISICAIGGYLDDKLNNLLDLDGLNESVIYLLALGEEKELT